MLRKFGFKKGEARESEARIKLQKELFAYTPCAEHGFPHKPSAIAYDPLLKLLAIGTKHGLIRVLGAPGVEFSGQHKEDVSISKLLFLPDQGRLLSLCSDNSLHLWEINFRDNNSVLEEVKSFTMEASNKLMAISAWCTIKIHVNQLLLGTEGGNIYILDLPAMTLSEQIIYQDVVMQNVPDDFKINPGAVEAIAQHPTNPNKYLIGYNRGLVVLWDQKESNADQTYNATQQLESVCWHRDGTQFMTAHADGSYIIWSSTDSSKPKEQANTPYGPFPCKAINKISWTTAKADHVIAFSGGMPRASYGDRNTVSVTQGVKQVVYDFTSRIIDFIPLCTTHEIADSDKLEYDDPHSFLVLAEEELVAIDLQSENWPCYRLPYLASLHSSAITCAQHVSNVPEQLWTKIMDAGEAQASGYSPRDWPVWGGKDLRQSPAGRDLFLTGHEDGSVRFWDASTICFKLVYKLDTASLFGEGHHGDQANQDGDEEWPPFRKVGTFDPYSDDPRLGVQKIVLCPNSETLVVGGTAGQVVVLQFEREEREHEVKVVTVNIVSDRDNFVWKAHDPLTVREGDLKFPSGFQPTCVMQLHPPATCTALALQSEWQLVAAGTGHGFGVFDYAQKKEVTTKCTLNPNDLTGTGESAMSRRKSFKKSLRESFRRLRKRRSERQKRAAAAAKAEEKPAEKKPEPASTEQKPEDQPAAEAATEGEGVTAVAAPPAAEATPAAQAEPQPAAATPTQEVRTIERSIEARSPDDGMVSMVRALYFADTFLLNAQNHGPTLWAGTNAGTIYVFQVVVPSNDKRDSEAVSCQLGKEIHLKHRAPVYAINVLDRMATPLPGPLEVQNERARAPDMTGHHQVVICSEEQFKIFSLPHLKPQNKFKLTAHEGSKVRKVGFVNFRSKSDENYSENDLAVLTNTGDINIFTMPQLRRQLRQPDVISRENVNGIASCVFTYNGLGLFQPSPSEYMSFSLSARNISKPVCQVELREGMRPPPPAVEDSPTEESPVEEQPAEATETDATAAEKPEGGAAEGDKAEEQAPAEGANDSVAAGDMTIDSVKVHLSDDANNSMQVVSQSRVTKMVVKRTVISEKTTEDGSTVSSQQTTTVREMTSTDDGAGASSVVTTTTTTSGDGVEGENANVPKPKPTLVQLAANWDDDTKMTKTTVESEASPTESEPLEELRIREEGDEDRPTATSTPKGKPPILAKASAFGNSASVGFKSETATDEQSHSKVLESQPADVVTIGSVPTSVPEASASDFRDSSHAQDQAFSAAGEAFEGAVDIDDLELDRSNELERFDENKSIDSLDEVITREIVHKVSVDAVQSAPETIVEEPQAEAQDETETKSAAETVAEATSLSAIESAMEALASEMTQIEAETTAEVEASETQVVPQMSASVEAHPEGSKEEISGQSSVEVKSETSMTTHIQAEEQVVHVTASQPDQPEPLPLVTNVSQQVEESTTTLQPQVESDPVPHPPVDSSKTKVEVSGSVEEAVQDVRGESSVEPQGQVQVEATSSGITEVSTGKPDVEVIQTQVVKESVETTSELLEQAPVPTSDDFKVESEPNAASEEVNPTNLVSEEICSDDMAEEVCSDDAAEVETVPAPAPEPTKPHVQPTTPDVDIDQSKTCLGQTEVQEASASSMTHDTTGQEKDKENVCSLGLNPVAESKEEPSVEDKNNEIHPDDIEMPSVKKEIPSKVEAESQLAATTLNGEKQNTPATRDPWSVFESTPAVATTGSGSAAEDSGSQAVIVRKTETSTIIDGDGSSRVITTTKTESSSSDGREITTHTTTEQEVKSENISQAASDASGTQDKTTS